MDNEAIVRELTETDARSRSNTKRLDRLDRLLEEQQEMALAVKELATNMKYMLEEQKKQGERLENLEKAPVDEAAYFKRVTVGCIITGAISAIISAVLAFIIK